MKLLYKLLISFLILIFLGCDRLPVVDPNDNSSTNPNDRVRPTLISHFPNHNSIVSCITSKITATFTEAIAFNSVNKDSFALFSNNLPILGSFEINSSSLHFIPQEQLSCQSNYKVLLTTNIRDQNGNSIADDITWEFSTNNSLDDTPPTIISVSPQTDATGVNKESGVIITFSESIRETDNTQGFFLFDGKGGSVTGEYTINTNELIFAPQFPLYYDPFACTTNGGFKSFIVQQDRNSFTMSKDNYIGGRIFSDLEDISMIIYYPGQPILIPSGIDNQQIPRYLAGGEVSFAIEFSSEILSPSFQYFFAEIQGVCYRGAIPDSVFAGVDTTLTAFYTNGFQGLVTTDITDLSGNPLDNNYTWRFFTAP